MLPIAAIATLVLLLLRVNSRSLLDPDVFHQMALAREIVRLGRVPLEDSFAYTQTIRPFVHHEWGSGMVLFGITRLAGSGALLALKYALAISVTGACLWTARTRGARWSTILSLAVADLLLISTGFSAVRAIVYTMLMTAVLPGLMTLDQRGRRGWILPWLLSFAVWVNLHAGFVVGLLLFACHVAETAWRRRPVGRLLVVLASMMLLVLANPYGVKLIPAVWHGITLDREVIAEWNPIWGELDVVVAVFGYSLLMAGYAAYRLGWRNLEGLPMLIAAAVQTVMHQRHLTLYAVLWFALVPAWIEATPLAEAIRVLGRRIAGAPRLASLITIGLVGCSIAIAIGWLREAPWILRIPVGSQEDKRLVYPIGAVEYLARTGFEGNVMTPFVSGAFVSWHLYPKVKVSMDGRYEAAYPPESAAENKAFYLARPGWQATLARDPTDLVLAQADTPIVDELGSYGWSRCYGDESYVLLERPGLILEVVERSEQPLVGTFP